MSPSARLWRVAAALARDDEDSGEDVAAIVTHRSDILLASANIVTFVSNRAAKWKKQNTTRSSPASGSCEWVPRYEVGAIHDHSMGGAPRGTVTHPEPISF